MALFEKGSSGNPAGRGKGTRNRLSAKFLEALAKDFEQHGEETIRIARVERPVEYMKVVASLLPKEFEFTDSRLADLSDDELDAFIELAKRQLGSRTAKAGSGKETTLN